MACHHVKGRAFVELGVPMSRQAEQVQAGGGEEIFDLFRPHELNLAMLDGSVWIFELYFGLILVLTQNLEVRPCSGGKPVRIRELERESPSWREMSGCDFQQLRSVQDVRRNDDEVERSTEIQRLDQGLVDFNIGKTPAKVGNHRWVTVNQDQLNAFGMQRDC
jgi:hypothetical protein